MHISESPLTANRWRRGDPAPITPSRQVLNPRFPVLARQSRVEWLWRYVEEEQESLFFFFEMMDPSHIEAIEREYKQIEDNEAWSQVYQVWYKTRRWLVSRGKGGGGGGEIALNFFPRNNFSTSSNTSSCCDFATSEGILGV